MGTGAYNSCCSDAMTLPISDWLFHLEGGTIPPYCTLQFLPFISIDMYILYIHVHKYKSEPSLYFYGLWCTGLGAGSWFVSVLEQFHAFPQKSLFRTETDLFHIYRPVGRKLCQYIIINTAVFVLSERKQMRKKTLVYSIFRSGCVRC